MQYENIKQQAHPKQKVKANALMVNMQDDAESNIDKFQKRNTTEQPLFSQHRGTTPDP